MDDYFEFPEQDTDVSGYDIRYAIQSKKVFKQYTPKGEFVSSDGWRIVEVQPSDLSEPLVFSTYQLVDPDGNVVGDADKYSSPRGIEATNPFIEVYYYTQRKGMIDSADFNIRFGPAHFPVGTVFEVDPSVGHYPTRSVYVPMENRQVRFEVAAIHRTGARRYVIETTTRVPDSFSTDLRTLRYAVSHTARIISRGKGSVKINVDDENNWHEQAQNRAKDAVTELVDKGIAPPKLKRGERIFAYELEQAFHLAAMELGLFDSLNDYNVRAMSKFIKTAGLGRYVTITNHADTVGEYTYVMFVIVKWKKLKKWVEKNYHRVLMPRNFTEAMERREDEAMCHDWRE